MKSITKNMVLIYIIRLVSLHDIGIFIHSSSENDYIQDNTTRNINQITSSYHTAGAVTGRAGTVGIENASGKVKIKGSASLRAAV